ncbi:hypothetical protein JTE90_026152 [Oedothorax gibbosus]|uniref:Uncharacterized protein n=1 Tax=Oedothorax gibbosus TaxID=931172 RepID=A0AAV6V1U6_9ARAC|nr:hypothetical protein JTE90_026152 [Oedothorax gibbosus]
MSDFPRPCFLPQSPTLKIPHQARPAICPHKLSCGTKHRTQARKQDRGLLDPPGGTRAIRLAAGLFFNGKVYFIKTRHLGNFSIWRFEVANCGKLTNWIVGRIWGFVSMMLFDALLLVVGVLM